MGFLRSSFGLGLIVGLVAFWGPIIWHHARIGGVFLTPKQTVFGEGQGPIRIEDTIHCEDVHYYEPANLVFTACEDTKDTRFKWFPGLGQLTPHPPARGSIHVVDPKVRYFNYDNDVMATILTVLGHPYRISSLNDWHLRISRAHL